MKVSVVIPAYNEAKYIGKCLEALLEQNEKADEIIVVDNNSKDRTAEIAQGYGVRVIKEPRQGRSFARSKGFKSAKYEIVARIDADTIASKNWIFRIKKHFGDENINVVSGPFHYFNLPKTIQISHYPSIAYAKILKSILKKNVIVGANMALRKSMWEKVEEDLCHDDSQMHDDVDLAIHLWKYTDIKFDRSLLVHTSPRRWKNDSLSYIEYLRRLIKTFKSHNLI